MELKSKPKKPVGRPKKYLDNSKMFEWYDERAHVEAKKEFDLWKQEFENCKVITGTEFENIQDYEKDLRKKYPELAKLDIKQLYIIDNSDYETISQAFRELSMKGKPSIDADTYTVKIPAERANEYSWYLSICEAFNNIRAAGATNINITQIPNITQNRIVFDVRSLKLVPNAYRFTKDAR